MKTLFILRHAKSSWDNPNLADFERPLNERGLQAAALMGRVVAGNNFRIDCLLSSPAIRAKQTANLVKEHGKLAAAVKLEDRIYEAVPQTLQNIVGCFEENHQSAMIVGHNPGLEGFIRFLTGEIHAMPTAALAVIDLNIAEWRQIAADSGELRDLIRSKNESKIRMPG